MTTMTTEAETYSGAQLRTALATTEQRIYEAAGDPGVDDVFYPMRDSLVIDGAASYTSGEFSAMLNAAADGVTDFDYEDSDVIWTQDVANLTVNVAGYLLEHPGAELDEIIPASYAIDFSEDDLDFDDLPEDAEIPAKGSPAWNAALTEKVCGWVA
jgi:hypothetical protein